MKKVLLATFMLLTVALYAKSQTLTPFPGNGTANNGVHCSTPIISLSGGIIDYSFSVYYPIGAARNGIIAGGAGLTIGVSYGLNNFIYYVEIDDLYDNVSTLPSGTVTYKGHFVLDQYIFDPEYSVWGDPVLFVAFNGTFNNGSPFGSNGYDEYSIHN